MEDRVRETIAKFYKVNKKVPSVAYLQDTLKTDKQTILSALDILHSKGLLTKIKNKYFATETALKSKPDKALKVDVTSIIMYVVGAICIYISIYYSRIWLINFLPNLEATLLSTVMVAYAAVSLHITRILFKKGKSNTLIGIVIILTAIVVTIFSMVSTVAGQYNTWKVKEETSFNVSKYKLEKLKQQEQEVLQEIDSKDEEIQTYKNILKEFQTIENRTKNGGGYYITTKNDLNLVSRQKVKLRQELFDLRKQIDSVITEEKVTIEEKDNFYTWLASILKVKWTELQFWLNAFPALFIDIIAPLAILVANIVRRKEHD